MNEIYIKIDCCNCDDKKIDIDDSNILCNSCFESIVPVDNIIESIKSVMIDNKYLFEDKDCPSLSKFKTEIQKKYYLNGVRYGMESALFFLARQYGDEYSDKISEFFEEGYN